MDNLSWGNPVAHRVRVHFNTASAVIYEGMPVCYNYDTTVNWAGGSVSDGAVTASTTLTAGTPETAAAKYLEVENPSTSNLQWFAGVVAKGGWCGKTVSATAGVGLLLDIYVPNGAIVPVRAGVDCTEGRTILAIQDASQSLEIPGTSSNYTSRPIAVAEETINRTTDGLLLAKLDPNLFICQDMGAAYPSDKLIVSTTGTCYSALNRINVIDAFTVGHSCALEVKTSSGAPVGSTGLGLSIKSTITGNATGTICAARIAMDIASGTPATGRLSALRLIMGESSATLSSVGAPGMAVLSLVSDVTHAPTTGNYAWIMVEDNGDQCPSHLFQVNIKGEMGDSAAGSGGTSAAAGDRMIPMRFGVDTYYLRAYADDSAN